MVTFDRSKIGETMALESVSAAETLIQSNNVNDDDLEDGEIPSDEDDDTPVSEPQKPHPPPEPPKALTKAETPKSKNSDNKFNKNKKQSSEGNRERSNKYKSPSEDWAGDVEKAIKAALDEDKGNKNQDNKSKGKNSKSKNRKRFRDEKEDDRNKDHKRRKNSDDENINEDDDEMLFVRGASPVRKGSHENSSPSRRNIDHDIDSNSDYDDRPSRHRDNNDSKRNTVRGRRGGKSERGGKNKGRNQSRSDRNARRTQSNDQDPDAICVYYMQGKCHRGDDCPFSHNALPPRKMELCKFYLMDCCAKRDKCLYMHHDFPCKFFHTGLKCMQGDNCKFSHEPLNEQVKNILLKHLETAPKEILGNFPRLSREGAILMINNTEKSLAQGHDVANQKIPSLLDMNVPTPTNVNNNRPEDKEGEADMSTNNQQKNLKERKQSGKKTRWGSDEDRVPYEQIMLLQSANQLGFQLPNAALGLAVQEQMQQQPTTQQQQQFVAMDFYNEINSNTSEKNKMDTNKDVEKDESSSMEKNKDISSVNNMKDMDLRQLLSNTNKRPKVVSIADEIANLTKSKQDEESDQDEETDLIIEMPFDEEEHDKDKDKDVTRSEDPSIDTSSSNDLQIQTSSTVSTENPEMPPNLPKKAQELFMRIQQQQRAAQDSFKNLENYEKEKEEQSQEYWYSDNEDDEDDEDDDAGNLTIVLKDNQKEESEASESEHTTIVKKEPSPAEIPQPAAIVDKLGDLSKIDISAEVSKLLSTIRSQSSKNNSTVKKEATTNEVVKTETTFMEQVKTERDAEDTVMHSLTQALKTENGASSPGRSPSRTIQAPRDPRVGRDPRDPRQRVREDLKAVPAVKSEPKDSSRYHRPETSIYSSGITAMDTVMDTDLRTRIDQDHRRKDMDLRQCFSADFGDTDLRVVGGGNFADAGKSDVDLRQMLSLPFKPAPSHIPCTEIDASISSHAPMLYKVFLVDIPRPDYTGLKLSRNDPQVKYDPRLRKIFRLTKADLADSPMSPPPMKLDTPKSPPQIRADPRRKALEIPTGQIPQVAQHGMPCSMSQGNDIGSMGMGPQYMSGPQNVGMGPMMMGPNPMLGNMGPMGPMMSGPMPPINMNMGPGMGPNSQMNFDPRYNQRNGGPGLLGPGPMGFNPDVGPAYEGQGFGNNFNNFGPNDPPMRPPHFGPSGPDVPPNFGNNGPDWNVPGQNQSRRGGRTRRRNRIKTGSNNRGNRSPS